MDLSFFILDLMKFLIQHLAQPVALLFIFILGYKQYLKKIHLQDFTKLLYNIRTVIGNLDNICFTLVNIENRREKIITYIKESVDPWFLPCLDYRATSKYFGCKKDINKLTNSLGFIKSEIVDISLKNFHEFRNELKKCSDVLDNIEEKSKSVF